MKSIVIACQILCPCVLIIDKIYDVEIGKNHKNDVIRFELKHMNIIKNYHKNQLKKI